MLVLVAVSQQFFRTVITLWLFFWFAVFCQAAPGDIDLTFGNNGKVITPFTNSTSDFAYAAAIQTDGKIVSASGTQDFLLTRHNPDGSLDETFGIGGKVITPIGNFIDRGLAVAIQANGKIVAAGATLNNFYDFAIVRYNQDGTLDNTFGTGGKVITAIGTSDDVANAIAIQSDGKIIVAGFTYSMNEDFAFVRYNSDGTLDNSFGTDGKAITQFGSGSDFLTAIAIQSDGKIVGAGSFSSFMTPSRFALVRYNTDGTLDNSFGASGKVITAVGDSASAFALKIQSDGKIITAGEGGNQNNGFALARYNTNGTLDTSFGINGTVITRMTGLSRESVQELLIQQNGKIVAVGYSYAQGSTTDNFALARYNTDGSLDNSFGIGGNVITPIRNSYDAAFSAVIQPDGKIIAVGYSVADGPIIDADFALVRYIGDTIAPRSILFDFDGDSKADISVFRPSNSAWYFLNSSNNTFSGLQFGISTDKIAAADFDGDGRTDVSVFRDGFWYRLNSSDNQFVAVKWGQTGDIPVPADFDGDSKADFSVFRPSNGTWYRLNSSTNQFVALPFGTNGDIPINGDFDGDNKADLAVYRPSSGSWYILKSTDNSFFGIKFGTNEDIPTAADYDGDGRTDISVYRPSAGSWYRLNSSTNQFFGQQFGIQEDIPVAADYDADGRADIAVFRPSAGTWYLQRSTAGFTAMQFGVSSDLPIPALLK